MNNSNLDIAKLMKALSNMDKKDLENSMTQLNSILSSGQKAELINKLKNNLNNK